MSIIDHLNITVVRQDTNSLVLQMPIQEKHLQPFGFVHGGVNLLLAETAASIGGNMLIANDELCFGQQINGHHIKAKRHGILYAHAQCQFKGKTSQVWQVNIIDEDEDLVCLSTCTLAVKKQR